MTLASETAKQLDNLGYTVHPLCSATKEHKHSGVPCASPGKVPLLLGWEKDDADKSERASRVVDSLGIRTGNGLLVVDADVGHAAGVDGIKNLKDLFRNQNEEDLLPNPTARTGGEGAHWYFRVPEGVATPRSTIGKVAPGIDTRGDKGQVVAPPSPHQSGKNYEWVEGLPPKLSELPLAPEWLIGIINGVTESPIKQGLKWGTNNQGVANAIESSLGKLANATGNSVHGELRDRSVHIYGFVKAGRADYDLTTEAIKEAYRRSGGNKPDPERDRVMKDAYDYATASYKKENVRDKIVREYAESGKEVIFLTKNAEGVRYGLKKLGVEWRYNVRTQKIEIKTPDDEDFVNLNDQSEGKIRNQLKENFIYEGNPYAQKPTPAPFNMGWEDWKVTRDAISYDAEVDTFKEYLEALPVWDEVNRLDSLLSSCFDLRYGQNAQLIAWASRTSLIGAVERTYRPGSELHQIPVLIGPQNIGKGTYCKTLVPPQFFEWGHKDFAFNTDDRKNVENTVGSIIIEWSELSGVFAPEQAKVKSWLSREH